MGWGSIELERLFMVATISFVLRCAMETATGSFFTYGTMGGTGLVGYSLAVGD